MTLIRNREVLIYHIVLIIFCSAGTALTYSFDTGAGFVTLMMSLLIVASSLVFSLWRYREIGKLSRYLERISSGDYSLEIRDNREGELSILKSEIYKMTISLRERAEGEEAAKRFLADTLSDISHQLKTPLTSLSVMTELLEDENLPQVKRLEFTLSIRSQLERLKWLMESLLKMSRLDSGLAIFKSETVVVRQLAEKAAEHLLVPLELKDQNLLITGDQELRFQCDANWTREALANVVKNAMEHTPAKGTIKISYAATPLYTLIEVEDNGGGIEPSEMPYIFNRFYKGKSSAHDSAGIGLAMARNILEKQGGTLDVRTRTGEGTVFSMKFYKENSR